MHRLNHTWNILPAHQGKPTLNVTKLEAVQLAQTKQSNVFLSADLGEGVFVRLVVVFLSF